MKRVLTMVLALVMVLSMATVSYAAEYKDQGELIQVDMDEQSSAVLVPGQTYEFRLTDGTYDIDEEFIDTFRVTVTVERDKDKNYNYISSAKLVKKGGVYYLQVTPKTVGKMDEGRTYNPVIIITCREKGLKAEDYRINLKDDKGELTGKSIVEYPEFVTRVELEVGFGDVQYITEGSFEVDNEYPINVANDISRSTLKFGSRAEYDARFGTSERRFNLSYSYATNASIVGNNPNANLQFVSFTSTPTFVTAGNLRIYMSNAAYMYEIKSNSMELVNATKGNGYMEYRTDKLTSYVVSDRALTGSVTTTTSSSSGGGTTASTSTAALTTDEAKTAAKQAGTTARNAGKTTATVRVTNKDSVSYEALSSMQSAAGMAVTFTVDTMTANGSAVDVRVSVNPALSVKGLNFSGSTTNAQAAKTKAFFEKWFSNKVVVVSLGQKEDFGQTASIAAKVDLSGMNTNNLVFYSYNESTNSYSRITAPAYYIDANGYLRFSTTVGRDIVISDGALK